jgi:ABC-2 type transport system ATP-binding protein
MMPIPAPLPKGCCAVCFACHNTQYFQGEPMIRATGLTKDFGSRRAIENLTFEAKQGEVVGFLGPNGAGKTTTMRILTGYMPPTYGTAQVAGFDVISESLEVRRRVGYLPETVPLYPEMTVYEYLKFMADLRHLPKGDEMVGYIANLTKGMRQRVGLAQALLHRPEVLILDEPTIGLDPAQVVEFRNTVRDVGRERTVLLSTHILSEAQQLCDRVLIINKGRIVAEDTPENLQSRLVGTEHVILRVKGEADDLLPIIAAIDGVQNSKLLPDGTIEFHFAPGADIRPAVARATIKAGYDLLEFHPIGLSLEEIFLQLTQENARKER